MGSQYNQQFASIQELIFGTTPAAAAGQIIRQVGMETIVDAPYLDNPEMRTDMMTAPGRRSAFRGKVNINGMLSYGTFDAYIAAALGQSAWAANVAKVAPMIIDSAATIAVAATGKTFTRADGGSFVTDGFAVGDYIEVIGATASGNNSTFVISTCAALILTCSTAVGLVDETANPAISIRRVVRPSFSIQEADYGLGAYRAFLGCVVDTMELSFKAGGYVETKFGLIAKKVADEAVTSIFSTLTQPNTNTLNVGWEGNTKLGGVILPNVVGGSLKTSRGLVTSEVCGTQDYYDILPKALRVTGSLDLYFDSMAQYTNFRNESDLAFQLNLGGLTNLGYQIDTTRARITGWKPGSTDTQRLQTVEYESYAPAAGTNTSLMVTRKP